MLEKFNKTEVLSPHSRYEYNTHSAKIWCIFFFNCHLENIIRKKPVKTIKNIIFARLNNRAYDRQINIVVCSL